jgi:NAD kinase
VRERVVLLTRPSEKVALERRYGTFLQARFVMAQAAAGAADFASAEQQDRRQDEATRRIRKALPDEVAVVEIDRALVAQFLFEPNALVVAVGQDGLVANAGKYVAGQPLAGVNPDPEHIDGALLAFTVDRFVAALPEILADRRPTRDVALAEATTHDGQVLRGFNEIFVGVPNHQSARYRIAYDGADELQSSSGLIAATGSGSTGWLRSLLGDDAALDPAAPMLRFCVREAWPGRGFSASIRTGDVTATKPLVIESRMPSGVIFADGIESDAIAFDAGMTVTIAPSPLRVRLLR